MSTAVKVSLATIRANKTAKEVFPGTWFVVLNTNELCLRLADGYYHPRSGHFGIDLESDVREVASIRITEEA